MLGWSWSGKGLAMQVHDALNELPEMDVGLVQSAYDVILQMLHQSNVLLPSFLQLAGQSEQHQIRFQLLQIYLQASCSAYHSIPHSWLLVTSHDDRHHMCHKGLHDTNQNLFKSAYQFLLRAFLTVCAGSSVLIVCHCHVL